MKNKIVLVLFVFTIGIFDAFSQSADCNTATAFCTGTNYSFPAATNTTAPVGPYYDCLFTQPNPAFYYLQIDQPGNLTINMFSTPLVDIDFICWGPFTDPTTMCDSLTQAYVEDCSYSPAPIEDCDIINAVTGQFYVLLITNYSNLACNIDFLQTGGNGTTDCCLLDSIDILDNLALDTTVLNVDCGVDVILTANAGIGLNYEWYDSLGVLVGTDPSLLIPSNGSYYVIASDASGCEAISDTFTVFKPNFGLNDFTISHTDVNCWDDTDGTISISIDDYINVLSYNFFLDGNLNTNSHPQDTFFSNVSAGYHVIAIVDDSTSCDTTVFITISAPGFPLQVLVSDTMNLCAGGSSGIAIGTAAGGTPGYSYEWFESGNPLSFSSNDTAFDLSAGSYFLEITDANGCDTSTSLNVIEPQTPLGGSPQIFGVKCKGDSTGMIVGDASGSWTPYIYYWLDMQGDTLQLSDTISTRDTLKNLQVGSYVLHLYDSKGCFVDYGLNVPEPAVALSIDSLKLIDGIACYGDSVGRAIAYIGGGEPPYYYEWDNGETTTVAEELTSGVHVFSLTDDWGCEVLDTIHIPENTLINSTLVVDTTVSCYGGSDGQASISTLGGSSSTYTYFWSTIPSQTTVGVNTDVAYGLLQGSYYVTTRDSLGCEVVDTIYISHPHPLVIEASELDWIDCFDADNGEAFAMVEDSTGTSPYSFSWDNGTWTGDTVTTLTPGVHTVVVTDARGCMATDTIFTHEPPALDVNIDDSQTILPYCIGVNTASLTAVASGGTGACSYEWDDNVVLPQTTATASFLLAGVYTITVTDSKGCTASDSRDIDTVTNAMDASITSLYQYASGSLDSNEISCFGYNDGGAYAELEGGHAPYTYEWYGPNSYVSTNDTINDLLAGVYSVTVRDTNNCMVNSSIVIAQPSNMFFTTLGATDESCLGACNGEIIVGSIIGGVGVYSALLTDNITGITTTHVMDSANQILHVCSGDYTISLTDVNACPSVVIVGGVDQQQVDFGIQTVAVIDTSTLVAVTVICANTIAGELTVLNPNTSPLYSYSWANVNNPTVILSDTITASNLGIGTYVLYADYANTDGCSATDTIVIEAFESTTTTVVNTHVLCNGDTTGAIAATVTGGETPYTYSWSNGAITQNLTNVPAGVYTLTVTDGNACVQTNDYTITQLPALVVLVTQTNYTLTVNPVSGGTSPYSYSWREQSLPTTQIGSGLSYVVNSYGTYYVIVTDANGCEVASNSFNYGGTTGLIQSTSSLVLSVYPNPFKQTTTVDFGQRINKATIRIVDVYGKLVESYELTDTDKYIIKRTNKASGIYFMEVEINKQYLNNIKLVIE